MGEVIDPRLPQWTRRHKPEEEAGDAVLELIARLMRELNGNTATDSVTPTIVQLAALRLVQKALISNYQRCVGRTETAETLRQASELAAQYIINGIDDDKT